MPLLQINLKKISPERSSLHCRRPDGTETWSRVHPFYPAHDLTHYSVETVLGLQQGFFGLIASGWELPDFIAKSVAARLPTEAFWAECAVGVTELLANRASPPTLAMWQDALDQSVAGQKLPPFRGVTPREYGELNVLRTSLLARWAAIPVGEKLALDFALRNESQAPA
jgi:hypothetical protein